MLKRGKKAGTTNQNGLGYLRYVLPHMGPLILAVFFGSYVCACFGENSGHWSGPRIDRLPQSGPARTEPVSNFHNVLRIGELNPRMARWNLWGSNFVSLV